MTILYTSHTGNTRAYAQMLAEKTGTPCHELGRDEPASGSEVLFLGWIRAGRVVGLKQAMKKWRVMGVCAVGMGYATEALMTDLRRNNTLSSETPLFYLQGGLFWEKLGMYRTPMKMVVGAVAKGLERKTSRSEADEDLLKLCREGGSRVCEANLAEALRWWEMR